MDMKLIAEFKKKLQEKTDEISIRISNAVRINNDMECAIAVKLLEEYAKALKESEVFDRVKYELVSSLFRGSETIIASGAEDDVNAFIAKHMKKNAKDDNR